MHTRRRICAALLCAWPALLLAACNAESPTSNDGEQVAAASQPQTTGAEMPAHFERTLPWGQGDAQLRLRPAGYETPARGPSAVAVAPTGAALVLDQLRERVVAVGAVGELQTIAEVPCDAEDLVAGTSGAFAAFSKVRAKAWFYDPSGTHTGTLPVPRSFLFLQRLSLDPAGWLHLHTGGQNTIRLGTPSARLDEQTARRGRRYGAALLADGHGVFAHVQDGQAELMVLEQPDRGHDKPSVAARHSIPGDVTAARVIGAHDSTVCLRLEHVESTPEVQVERRAFCLDVASGAVLFDEALPPPGLYPPRSELAMSGHRLAFIHPTAQGLRVTGWRIPASADGEEVQP